MYFKQLFENAINEEEINIQKSVEKVMETGKCYICESPLKYKLFKGSPPGIGCYCTNITTKNCTFAKNRMYAMFPEYKNFKLIKGGITSQKLLGKE